jgi:hypothetical protein
MEVVFIMILALVVAMLIGLAAIYFAFHLDREVFSGQFVDEVDEDWG